MITVRYFGGAAEAAGAQTEQCTPVSRLDELTSALAQTHPGLEPVLAVCSFMVNEQSAPADAPLPEDALVDVLPPFAGG
ncbi:MoaD/ThiS family protein [Propionibacterium australiense]|uniref:MoaD/ThiS family protein n=1 Tax=Propionibacterium australiense TaxID=119981 RepID=A0A383S7Z5_9ACTN|nr:MoaD/ThiS family protein [Propionibacterium australiense]RLP07609.1 MoaD/ThiS family protein [Propionibacterium australiense]RLP08381.1 MoaD/ThiS family protein [Propionibacterium australiense]SYZ33963.1 ThiamineS/Molybdopterin converting factor subunit 1 [Propionibacterium australiense]VEH88940.1 molybdopterin converting factor, subunit 1 [Propionibacterium australiense]